MFKHYPQSAYSWVPIPPPEKKSKKMQKLEKEYLHLEEDTKQLDRLVSKYRHYCEKIANGESLSESLAEFKALKREIVFLSNKIKKDVSLCYELALEKAAK